MATSVAQTAPLEWQLSVDGPWQDTDVEVANGIRLTRFGLFAADVTVGVPEPSSLLLMLLAVVAAYAYRRA